jgi:hypothetical protein
MTNQILDLDKKSSTLQIELDKHTDNYHNTKGDLDEAVERLH